MINEVEKIKVKGSWNDDDKKTFLFDKMDKNMLQSALGMDEFSVYLILKWKKRFGTL